MKGIDLTVTPKTLILSASLIMIGLARSPSATGWDDYKAEFLESLKSSLERTGQISNPGQAYTDGFASNTPVPALLKSTTFQDWSNSSWINVDRHRYAYNDASRRVESALDRWSVLAWINLTIDSLYWTESKAYEDSVVSIQSVNLLWIKTLKTTTTLDQSGRLAIVLYQDWLSGSWVNSRQLAYSYNQLGQLDSLATSEFIGQQWYNTILTTHTYNQDGLTATNLDQEWINEGWVNLRKTTFGYDSDFRISAMLTMSWDGNQWVSDLLQTFSYSSSNPTTVILLENWQNSTWINMSKVSSYTNSSSQIDKLIFESWTANQWTNNMRWLYEFSTGQTDVSPETASRPVGFELKQNAPNPFNPSTLIAYTVERKSHIKLSVYNVLGQNVRILVDGDRPRGNYTADWDGRDQSGNQVASGLYFYRLQTESGSTTKKMILLR